MALDPELVDKKTITVKYTDWGEYRYYGTFIVSFGYRGAPTNDVNTLRVRTIWADGEVIYFRDTAVSTIRKRSGLTFNFRQGTEDQTPFGSTSLSYRGQILLYFSNYDLGTSPNSLPAITAEFEDTDGTLTVADILETLSIRAGFVEDAVIIEGLLDQYEVVGYILNSQSTLESVAADLGYLYDFSMTEYAGTITFRHAYDEDNNIVIQGTIPDGRLAVLNEKADDQQYDTIQRGSDNNQPLSLTATYYDYDMNYDPGSQTVNRNSGPLRTQNSNLSVSLSLPIVAHGDEIRSRLLNALYRHWESKNGHSIRLGPEFLYLDAGDIIAWQSYEGAYTGQMVKATLNADFSQSVSVTERSAVYTAATIPTETPEPPDVVVSYNVPLGLVLDIPDTAEAQATDGFLNLRVAVGPSVAGEAFYGARLDMTPSTMPTAWAPVQVFNTLCEIGTLFATPAVDATEIIVNVGVFPLSRFATADVGDLVVFGSPGYFEIAEFVGYTDNLDNTVTVELIRGQFGTDDLINTHLIGDYFLFHEDTINVKYRVEDYRAYTQYLYRFVAAFQPTTEAPSALWVPQGNSRKPYSPNAFVANRELNGDLTFTWEEDPRFTGEPDTVFSLDIWDHDGTHVVRRFQNIDITIQTYFIEEQTLDGTDGFDEVYAVLYQVNASHVGRGFPAGGLLTINDEGIFSASVLLEMVVAATIDQDILLEGTGLLAMTADADFSGGSGFVFFEADVTLDLTADAEFLTNGLEASALLSMEVEADLSVSTPLEPEISSYSLGVSTGSNPVRLVIDRPANTVDGDLLVFAAYFNVVAAAGTWAARDVDELKTDTGADAGFTVLEAQKLGSSSPRPKAMLSWKIADNEPASYEWAEWGTAEVAGQRRGILMRFTNFDDALPILSDGYLGNTAATRIHTAPSVTGEPNGFLFNIVFPRVQLWTISTVHYTKPADMTWLFAPEDPGGVLQDLIAVAHKDLSAAGATGSKTYVPPVSSDPTNTNNTPYMAFSFVVNATPTLSATATLDLTVTADLTSPVGGLQANAVLDLDADASLNSDPHFANVVLLMHMNGTDGSTTFVDEIGHTMTPAGNAQIDTAQSVFNGSSALFDGTGDYISTPDSADWEIHATSGAPFTIEFRVRPTSIAPASDQFVIAHYNSTGNQRSWGLQFRSDGNFALAFSNNGTSFDVTTLAVVSSSYFSNNVWRAVAIDFDGTTARLYIDGVMRDSLATGLVSFFNSTADLTIGAQGSPGNYFNGHIAEVRITKGVARYASNSGYTVATVPFPND